MALKGNLQDFGTTQLLNLVHLARKTGALQLENGTHVADLYFHDGKLIHASATGHEGLLTTMLVEGGKLSPQQARAIQARAQGTSDKRLAMILIQNNYVSKDDVVESVTRYMLDLVYQLFSWTEGRFSFEPDIRPDQGRITIPIELSNVIMEGSRRVQELERLEDELPDLDMALKFTDHPDAKLRNIALSENEWKIINYVKPTNSIRQIAHANKMNDFQIRRIVYGMLQAGLVDLIAPPGLVRAAASASSGSVSVTGTRVPTVKRSIVTRLIDRIKRL